MVMDYLGCVARCCTLGDSDLRARSTFLGATIDKGSLVNFGWLLLSGSLKLKGFLACIGSLTYQGFLA
jgi:hypothetical protein